ncbi:ABC transporter family substrate-binding protein [Brevibacterium moorei]|uniref:ABC transporter family substrate-binding protein n=1 Tax=Brevibacterium moorei TaxID=2968457 RepID=UPI00211BBDFE|nr:ABC transporter family substrate-binding protein [Brevibacterium sp. 68QC2CO]MCQ9386970.1 ABC transporter family substrate-binding protein [Brevibacterium sp. 68QC2CO]
MKKRILSIGAAVATAALILAGCTPNNAGGGSADTAGGGEVKVMWNQPFYSSNIWSSASTATTNANTVYLMSDSFKYYDKDLKLADNKSFGTMEKVSDKPMKVKYTIADTATWSDGTPYTAADLVLGWGARSGNFNTGDLEKAQDDEGNVKKQKGENVLFNASSFGLQKITKYPEVSDDLKSVTFTYDQPFADWETNLSLQDSGLPAHIVAKKALGIDDATKANDAILKAFKDDDKTSLAKVANVWNTGFNFTKMPEDKDLLVNTGPYQMTDYQEGQFLTLEKRDDYKGERNPSIDKVTIRYNSDPNAQVQALQNGEADLINPQATADILKSMQAIDGVKIDSNYGDSYERLDLAQNNGGAFDPKTYGGDAEKARKVREAFLLTVPREKIVSDIVKPLKDDITVRNSFTQVPGSPHYDEVVKASGFDSVLGKQDIDKAKQLLKEAGVTGKPKVRFLYAKGNERREQIFRLVQEAGAAAGFDVQANAQVQWSTLLPDTSQYDVSTAGWGNEHLGVTQTVQFWRSGGNHNHGGYKNPEVDKLYDQLQGETDESKQVAIEEQIEKHVVSDAVSLPIFQFPDIVGARNTVSGVDAIAVAPNMFWNYWEWKLQ